MLEYKMPSLGADMESGFLREWHVQPGDRIRKGDIIAEVETQKGIIEIEVFEEGIIGELLVKLDEQVPVGRSMATILTEEEAARGKAIPAAEAEAPIPEKAAQAVPTEVAAPRAEEPAIPEHESEPHHIRASPLAKRVAAEKGIDIATVHGTGPEGAITRDDVEHAITAQAAPATAARDAKTEAPPTPTPTIPVTKAEIESPPIPEPKPSIPAAKAPSASAGYHSHGCGRRDGQVEQGDPALLSRNKD
jgi:pyruvate dehydrogenase E2 component (dihydrolipoamide acetyltransferase)